MIEEKVKFNVPLITKEELRYIDYNYNNLVEKYLLEYKSQRDHLLTQRLIYNLERENKKLKKQNKFLMKRENKLQVLEMKQKEFIKCLEDEKDRLIKETSHYYIDSFDRQHSVNETIYDEVDMILQKYKSIIGDDK